MPAANCQLPRAAIIPSRLETVANKRYQMVGYLTTMGIRRGLTIFWLFPRVQCFRQSGLLPRPFQSTPPDDLAILDMYTTFF